MRYEAPETLDAAVGLLTGESGLVKVLAGGTDVLVQIHADMIEPDLIVDIKNIDELRAMSNNDGAWTLGAAVTGKELMDNANFNAAWPGVMDGVRLIGSVQVRGRSTVGGNVCNASPAADSVPAMIAARAVATIVGPKGTREVPVEDVAIGPGKTSLEAGEFVVSFQLPKRPPNSGDAYLRFTPRTEMDIAVVGCGVNLTLDDSGTCTDARISLGAVAARALVVEDAAKALVGTKVDDGAMEALAAAASAACSPIDDKRGTIEYRTEVAGVLAQRAAAIAVKRAKS
jgi:carbon-monoxide dehydrogenase medium subunit